jgi:hypothetical protein
MASSVQYWQMARPLSNLTAVCCLQPLPPCTCIICLQLWPEVMAVLKEGETLVNPWQQDPFCPPPPFTHTSA